MKFNTLTRRAAAAGAASALVAGALVGATSTAAQAAPVTNTYLCTSPVGSWDVTLLSDAPLLNEVDQINAGQDVPGGLLTVTNTFTIPNAAKLVLDGASVENLSFPDFAGEFGGQSIPVTGVTGTVSSMTQNADTTWSFTATDGLNAAFEVPAAGTYDVLSPAAFTMVADMGGTPVPVDCAVADGTTNGAYKTLPVLKNDSATTAKAKDATIKKGDVARIVVKVAALNETPRGKVILKKGAKTLAKGNLNKKGKVVLKAKKGLKLGKNKLKALYKGDGYTNKSASKAIVVKVRR